MREEATLDHESSALARRALLITLGIGTVSSGSGLLASTLGMVSALEFIFVACIFIFTLGALITLLAFRRVAVQTVATAVTCYYAAHMCVGVWISLSGAAQHINLFIYLLWFFPILVFNKLVNQPAISRLLGRILLVVPLLTILCLLPRWTNVLPQEQRVLLGIYCLTYICYALTLNIVTRYREKYVVEQERVESLKITAQVLESISDCFISVDADFHLIYLNDAACAELGVDRQTVLNDTLNHAAPRFFSRATMKGLQAASLRDEATLFEAQNEESSLWHDLRCFPRLDGMSIYFRDITHRKNDEARIHYLAFYDVLTGLPNRQLLSDRLSRALITGKALNTIGALLYIDLDDFKTLNDTMGHEVGDALLRQVASRLTSCLRPSDTIARIGGDEFSVMLESLGPDLAAATTAARCVGEKILSLFHKKFVVGTCESETKASVGITLFGTAQVESSTTSPSETVDDLLRRADLAMYSAKAQGGNNVCFFDPAMQADVDTRAALRADLRYALQSDQLSLHYQPQVDSEGNVCGSEALLRWCHPVRGNVPPNEFIPLAEEAGLIVDLGRWVLQTGCLQLAAWSADPAMKHLTLAINVSVQQLLSPHFVDTVKESLRFSGAVPSLLKLEITESSVMEKVNPVIGKMLEIKSLGVTFSLDDFGTGYSSLSHLRHLPLDQLKIDRSFIAHVLTDEKCASIVRTIVILGHTLRLSVIAEGVETEPQRAFLADEGCHLYQGFLYSPAVPASQFEAYVVASNPSSNGTNKEPCRSKVAAAGMTRRR
jgi:diguanylate cyclase (GGDEF)-like protein